MGNLALCPEQHGLWVGDATQLRQNIVVFFQLYNLLFHIKCVTFVHFTILVNSLK